MSLNEWIPKILIFLSGSTVTILGILYLFITKPDKIVEWGSIFFKIMAYFSQRSEKIYMKTNIQSSIAKNIKKLSERGNVLSFGLEIRWIEEENADVDLKENNVIIMMRPFKSQAKNYANIVSLYVPSALLPKSRRYINDNLIMGLDYAVSKTLLESNPTALSYYIEHIDETHTDDVKAIIKLLEPCNAVGRTSRIMIPEFKYLNALYPMEPNEDIKKETLSLARRMNAFNTAPTGSEDEKTSGIFNGEYFKMAMVPVGDPIKLLTTGIETHLNFIEKQIKNGITHFYIVSASSMPHAKQLSDECCRKFGLNKINEEEYNGIFRGSKRRMYCSLCILEK